MARRRRKTRRTARRVASAVTSTNRKISSAAKSIRIFIVHFSSMLPSTKYHSVHAKVVSESERSAKSPDFARSRETSDSGGLTCFACTHSGSFGTFARLIVCSLSVDSFPGAQAGWVLRGAATTTGPGMKAPTGASPGSAARPVGASAHGSRVKGSDFSLFRLDAKTHPLAWLAMTPSLVCMSLSLQDGQ